MARDRLARDLELWARQLGRMPEQLEAYDWQTSRAIALHLMVDVRPDVAREVGGRTLDAGRGRRRRGYRAGVWAASHRGSAGDWWVGGTGKLHWLDQGTDPHPLTPKRRRRGRATSAAGEPLLALPWGPRYGTFRHPGSRGTRVYGRSVDRHATAALNHGAVIMQRLVAAGVMPRGR